MTVNHFDLVNSYRPPDWYPLQRALALVFGTVAIDATAAFWFIGFVHGPADMGALRLYEHSTTRRRVALDRNGGAYRWFDEIGGYSRSDNEEALIAALV